jgi:hypothetical protein
MDIQLDANVENQDRAKCGKNEAGGMKSVSTPRVTTTLPRVSKNSEAASAVSSLGKAPCPVLPTGGEGAVSEPFPCAGFAFTNRPFTSR